MVSEQWGWYCLYQPYGQAQRGKGSVALQNCFVKRSGDNDDFEVHVNNKTSFLRSPKKFKVDDKLIAMEATHSAILTSVEEIKML